MQDARTRDAEEDRPPLFPRLTALDPAARIDPYPVLAEARATSDGGMIRDARSGCWLALDHACARTILADFEHWKNPERARPEETAIRRRRETTPEGLDFPEDHRVSMLDLDPPDHARVREPIVAALNARVAAFHAEAETIVERVLDGLDGGGRADLVAAVAEQVPIACIGAILGVPAEENDAFRCWVEGLSQTFNPSRTAEESRTLARSSNAVAAFMRRALGERRGRPSDDLIGDMARVQAAGAPLTDAEITFNLRGLLIAGHVTTTDLIANAAWLVLTHPDARRRLMLEPGLWAGAVEEALRLESPVDFTWRIACRSGPMGGVEVGEGEAVSVFLRGANRDPAAFEAPDVFDISRRGVRHVAFGGGAHGCPGAPLARMEARITLRRLFERYPAARLADPDAPPAWRGLPGFRGLERLEVRLD